MPAEEKEPPSSSSSEREFVAETDASSLAIKNVEARPVGRLGRLARLIGLEKPESTRGRVHEGSVLVARGTEHGLTLRLDGGADWEEIKTETLS